MQKILLPRIEAGEKNDLMDLLMRRRSTRKYVDEPLSLRELAVILWSGYGCKDEDCRRRTVPSAGATYPLEIYVSIRRNGVSEIQPGIYLYKEREHALVLVREGDYSYELYRACLGQKWVLEAPVNIIISARPEKTTAWYGSRGLRYVYLEAGHSGQNIYLAATMLGLGTVAVGAFLDEDVRRIIGLKRDHMILYVFPVGKTRL